MNNEQMQLISSRIEAEDTIDREQALNERLIRLSLVYAQEKYRKSLAKDPNCKFSVTVRDNTPIADIITRAAEFEGPFSDEYRVKLGKYLDSVYIELGKLEASGATIDELTAEVTKKITSIRDFFPEMKVWDGVTPEKVTKLLSYNTITNISRGRDKKYEELSRLGYSQFDHFLEVHVESFFKSGEKSLGPEIIKEDLQALALLIVEQEPKTAAVVGKSWLLNTPLAKSLGFQLIGSSDSEDNDISCWLQFVDKNGEVDKKRFDAFTKTGEIPYKSVKGIIPVEEFLKRYLPPYARGEISLKAVNPATEKVWFERQKAALHFKEEWGRMINGETTFDEITQDQGFIDLINLLGEDNKRTYLSLLSIMAERKSPWGELRELRDEELRLYDQIIQAKMEKELYVDKKLIIE